MSDFARRPATVAADGRLPKRSRMAMSSPSWRVRALPRSVMVIFELLGRTGSDSGKVAKPAEKPVADLEGATVTQELVPARATRRSKVSAKGGSPVGSVKTFVHDRVFPAHGERLDIKMLTADYWAWCAQKGVAALALARFLDEIEIVCHRAGIAIEVRVYCLDVKLENATAEPARVH